MVEKYRHSINVIDFRTTSYKTTFVKFEVYDAEVGKRFNGDVRFVDGMPFGDVIHPQKSPLSSSCRELVRERLLNKYNEGEFE